MGRVKLQIKKIENNTNRQVTFSKRRSGLIKKAHEISVLCDVDVALVLFSPSGRVTVFSGTRNTSIGDILTRYVNLPEHERERIQNREYIQRTLGKLKNEADPMFQVAAANSSPISLIDAQVENMQKEILKCKCQLEDLEKKLRVYECNPAEISTIDEAKYREQVLEDNLKNIRLRKDFLQDHYNSASQVMNLGSENAGLRNPGVDIMGTWLPDRSPDVQILNFLDSNGLLPLRDQRQSLDSILPLSLVHDPCLNAYNHLSPGRTMEDDSQRTDFGQAIDVNLSPWADQLYPTGSNQFPVGVQPREHALELFLSQLAPADPNHL